MRSCLRDFVCNFRPVETARLQRVLMDMGDDLKLLLREVRGRERLIWVLTLGAVTSEGEDRKWFAQILGVLCEVLGLGSWSELRKVLVGVLWIDGLDKDGLRICEEMNLTQTAGRPLDSIEIGY